jgi:hypothetical protein
VKRYAILALLLGLPLLTQAAEPRVLNADIPAKGIDTLALAIGIGELRITSSSDDALHIRVSLQQKSGEFLWFFHWHPRATLQEIQSAQITQKIQGKRLVLSLTTPTKFNSDDVKQKWVIALPERMALDLNMKVGEATISGIAGGVQADLNVGELNVEVPRGALNAKVNVGQISVDTDTQLPGNIVLSSNIGEAVLYMNGKHIRHAGNHTGLGRRIDLDGSGPDSMNLKVNVGEVDLRINSSFGSRPNSI